jgi:hypothetical protein
LVFPLRLTSLQMTVKWNRTLNMKVSRMIRFCRDFQTVSDYSVPNPLNGVYSRLLRGKVTALTWVRSQSTSTTIKISSHSIYFLRPLCIVDVHAISVIQRPASDARILE